MIAAPNLDLARSICADWERGDFNSTKWAHPEIEYVHADGPAPGSWTGLAGMANGLRDFLSAWDKWLNKAEEFRELDEDRVLVLIHYGGRGKASGLEIGQMRATGASLFQVRAGKVTRLVIYLDREHAFAELGLPPETDPPAS